VEDQPILKKTFYTVAVMLAAWVAFVGALSLVAVLVTARASGGSHDDEASSASTPSSHSPSKPSTGASNAPPHRI
jgi:hypothetical protein